MKEKKILWRNFFFLIGTTCFFLVLASGGFWIWKNDRNDKLTNQNYLIRTIVQTGPKKEALKTAYLAQLLGLCVDQPSQLYVFDLKKGRKALLSSPLIKKAHLKRLFPSTLYIDYEVYKPIAYLADFKNLGIDENGHVFPLEPFFPPKRIPEIYLGISKINHWKVESPHFQLAVKILKFLETAPWKEGLNIKRIDVSNAFALSLGQREVVLLTEEEVTVHHLKEQFVCIFPKIVRLNPKDYTQQLVNFFQLQKKILQDYKKQLSSIHHGGRFAPRIVDLRIPQLAFVEKG